MTYTKELKDNLIKVLKEAYDGGNNYNDDLKTILDEHKNTSLNEINKLNHYYFVENTLQEIKEYSGTNNHIYSKLINSIYKTNDLINWYPNTTFENPETAIHRENFCANLIGKTRDIQRNPYLFHNDKIIGGLFLMGKNQVYPKHYHPARETWIIISGKSQWKIEDGQTEIKKPGDCFTIYENQSHMMKTQEENLLCLWAWTGDMSSWARWTK